ncbi:hypothetical protein BG000_008431 [Podila horticola]|nr:hypothetical protein BG000_008431 [Podila horticola]
MTKIKPRLIARISCQECRRRKTRCNFDGQGEKCSTCARIGTPCIFSQKNGTILDMDKVMEENNPHLVHRREKEQRAKDRARLASISSISSSTTSHVLSPDMSLYSKSTPSSSFLSGNPFVNRPSRSNSTTGVWDSRASSTEDLSSVMDRLQIDAFGIAPHTLRSFSQVAGDNDSVEPTSGESSSAEESTLATFPPGVETMDDDDNNDNNNKAASPKIGKTPDRDGSVGADPPRRHRSSRSRSVPLVDIQPDLIESYFRHVHPFLLVLHKPSFFRRLHDPKDPVPDFLLAAMYAVASHYVPGREEDGRRYFQLWLSRLDDTMDKPRLSTIQALLMIIKYQEGVKNTGFYFRTYMYTQMVIVLARELQLHKATHVNAKLDPENHEVRRRLFWAIFVLDQFLAVSQGRTMSFREVEPEADLPRTDNEDPNDIEEIETIENAVEYIKLVKIDHQALILVRKFLTKVVAPEETIPQGLFLHQAMLAWKANLPPRLQLATNMSPHTPFVAMLHILYHACAIMVQRCYCEDPSISDLEVAAVSRETCTVSATNITVIIDDLYTNHGMVPLTYPLRGCYFIIYCLIAAATIQVNDLRQGSNGPIMFKRSLALLNLILRQSTAVDVEKEVALLKSSLDTHMEGSYRDEYSGYSPRQHYDHRPPLKPILPMSQKYGSRMSFSSTGVTPVRVRKISPKGSGPTPHIQPKATSTEHPRTSSLEHEPNSKLGSSPAPTSRPANSANPSGACEIGSGSQNQSEVGNKSSSVSSSSGQSMSPQLDDLDMNIKSSPSPNLPLRLIPSIMESPKVSQASYNPTSQSDFSSNDSVLRSVPTFTAPASLPPDFNAFATARQQALAVSGAQQPAPLMSLAQFLTFQQQQQQQQQQLQETSQSIPQLGQLTAAQIQELHMFNQQRQLLQLQQLQQLQQTQQQLQQSPDPAFVSALLSNFSALNNYQQINSDRAQYELLSMLNSTNYGDASMNADSSFMQTPSQQQQQNLQDEQDLTGRFYTPQDERQRSQSTDGSLMADTSSHDTPSPESFTMVDMAGSFPAYLGADNAVPLGIRQALSQADKIFKFQQQDLTNDSEL